MTPSISINTLCFQPASLGSHADTVARLGVGGISPDLEQVTEFGISNTARLFRDAGLKIATLTHRAFAFSTPQEAAAGQERLRRTIGVAVEIGAQSIIMTTGGRGQLTWAQAVDRFSEAVAPCAELARAAGIHLGIEPTSHLYADVSIAHRLSDALRVAKAAGIAVMIDTFACWFDSDIESAIAEAAPHAALVQVSDYVYADRALPCRAVPGDGDSGLDRLIPAIVQAGFRGWFDLEIIGPRLQAEGQEAGLRRAAEFMAKVLGQCEPGMHEGSMQ